MGKGTGAGRSSGDGGSKGRPGGAGGPGGAKGRPGGAKGRPGGGGSGASESPRDRQQARERWSRAHHRHYHNELSYQGDYDFRPRRSNTQTFFVIAVFGLILLGLLWLVLVVFF